MKSFLLYIFLIFLFGYSRAQNQSFSPHKGHYFIENFSNNVYNASSQNWSFTQTNQGQIVVGNVREILLYNGKNWKSIEVNNSLSIRSMDKSADGTIYVGTNNDFGRIELNKKGNPVFLSLAASAKVSRDQIREVWKTYATPLGVFFQCENHIFLFKNNRLLKKWETTEPGFQFSFWVKNKLFIRHKAEGIMYIDERLNLKKIENDFFVDNVVSSILPYGNSDSVLISTKDNGLFIGYNDLSTGKIKAFTTKADELFYNYYIYKAIKLNDGNYCFAIYNNGCLIMSPKGEIIEHINKENGILNDRVWSVYQDKDQNIWLGLDKGISKIEYGIGLKYYDEKDGFEGRAHKILSFENQLYLATIQGLYSKNTDGNFKNIMNNQDLYWDIEFIKDSYKTMAVASKSGLLVRNDRSELFIEGDFRDITVFKNQVYAVANNTLYKVSIDKKGIITREKQVAETGDIVQQIEFDQNENIWLGLLDYGVRQVINPFKSNCKVRAFDTTSGLPDIIANKPVLLDNQIYFLTTAGLYEFENNRFIKSKLHSQWFGKDSLQIWSFFKDSKNRCWMQINRFTKGALVNKTEVGYYDLINKKWVSNIFKRLPQTLVNGFSEDEKGIIYMASDEGVFVFENKKYEANNFYVNFSFIRSGSDTLLEYAQSMPNGNLNVTKDYQLSMPIRYTQMPLLINFSSPFFNSSESTEYSYLLEGDTKAWSEWSRENKKEYTKLSPGTYTFKVKARNIFGDETPVNSFTFKILPPWYLTWWAYLLYLISFVAIIYGIVQLSVYRLKQAKIKLENIVTERTVEVVKQKDEILEQKGVLEKQKLAIERFNEELSHKNKEITDSIQYAKKIQEAILVEEQTIYNQLPESFILYKPRDIVSGDFYWYHELDDGLLIAAADCTGHGVPGAFMSMIGSTLLNEIVDEKKITSPEAILNQLNIEVRRSLKQDEETSQSRDGMDIALCKINILGGNLKYAGAMRPLYIIRNIDERIDFEEIKATKNPIGGKQAEEKREFVLHNFNFNKGDTVYFFSDGYADQFGGPEGKKFMTKKFQQLLISLQQKSMPEQKQLINEAFENWRGEHDQVDDVLVIGIRF